MQRGTFVAIAVTVLVSYSHTTRVTEKGATAITLPAFPVLILAGSVAVSERPGMEMNSTLDGRLLGINVAGSNENVSPDTFSRISVVRVPDWKSPPSTGR
jgi:hypothetical protein